MSSISSTTDDDDQRPPPPKATPTTPRRSAQNAAGRKRTPNSAPVRKTAGKKGEPSLFQDFLLGRPSPARTGKPPRRKSLDGVKKELRLGAEEVAKVQSPGGVKDRVKQWQKASAAAVVIVDSAGPLSPQKFEQPEKQRQKESILPQSSKRPGRRRSKEAEDVDVEGEKKREEKERSKSAAAPKKRVISDSHWMKKGAAGPVKEKERERESKGSPIPKDFLTSYKTSQNPPLEKKIQDWARRNASIDAEAVPDIETPKRRKVSRQENVDQTTPRKVSEARVNETPKRRMPGRTKLLSDDGIRVRATPESSDDGTRITPLPDKSRDVNRTSTPRGATDKPARDSSPNLGDDGIRIRPIRKERRPKEEEPAEFRTPRKRSEKHLRPPDLESHAGTSNQDTEDTSSCTTPSRTEAKRRPHKSGSPSDSLSEIPFGNSAFSVLDLPVGAEANTLHPRPAAKRNPSFKVPKVLKKVFDVGREIVNDTIEPPRVVGSNQQPPSIESWLKATSDPFVEQSSVVSESTLEIPEDTTRRRSHKDNDEEEQDAMTEVSSEHSRRKRRVQSHNPTPSPIKTRDTLPSMDKSSTTPPPAGLKRSPATRTTSSPKSMWKAPLKAALLDAFRGESSTFGEKGNPMTEITGVRETRSYPQPLREDDYIEDEPSIQSNPRTSQRPSPEVRSEEVPMPLPAFPRRMAPTTGQHRLSTIASVETFSTGSTLSATESEFSQTTVTQSTIYTAPTDSTLSRNSNKSGLKRRLTKHSDLMSVLSLPDNAGPGKARSIRSAKSVTTKRARLESATLQDLLQELATDETKYVRELKTLVDGVIPVLLTCVLSKSNSAIAAGLFNPNSGPGTNASLTKPIVDMGVALERLKSLHNRIPLENPVALVAWLNSAHKSYDDFLTAWRMGFQDVVVNLAPASASSGLSQHHDDMPRNANGDVVNGDGERVDVAFLLKRPFVRVKYLAKLAKGLNIHNPSATVSLVVKKYTELEEKGRRRTKEEAARMVDLAANTTDTARARDPETLALADDVKIDQSRQVCAKDCFSLDMYHSSGQRVECEVELFLRDKPYDVADHGDVLICAIDDVKKWLLFPPIAKTHISARMGDTAEEIIIMIRGKERSWEEVFLLKSDDPEAASEWIDMLGTIPIPPAIIRDESILGTKLSTVLSMRAQNKKQSPDLEVPIGETRRRQAEEEADSRAKVPRLADQESLASVPLTANDDSVVSGPALRNLNDAMKLAGKTPYKSSNTARARYHSPSKSASPVTSRPTSRPNSQDVSTIAASIVSSTSDQTDYRSEKRDGINDHVYSSKSAQPKTLKDHYMSGGIIPDGWKLPNASGESNHNENFDAISQPGKDNMKRPQSVQLSPPSPTRDDVAPPPPPAHRVPTTPTLKTTTIERASPSPKNQRGKNRRTSSPLKHEYQPSNASETSSSSATDSDSESETDSDSYTGSSEDDDDELEAPEFPEPRAGPASFYSMNNTSLAPSNSASQGPYRGVPVQRSPNNGRKIIATISCWNGNRWVDLHPDPCSIVVSDGLIEAFELNASHSSPRPDSSANSSGSSINEDGDSGPGPRPLIAQGLTPNVQIRKSTMLDLEISKSAPLPSSLIPAAGSSIRYRTLMIPACTELFHHVSHARNNNLVFNQLARERVINSYGINVRPQPESSNRRSWLGRKKSYRVSARAPSSEQQSAAHSESTFARLRRMSGNNAFNIEKSTVAPAHEGNGSQYTESSNSIFSFFSRQTPPGTPSLRSQGDETATTGVFWKHRTDLKIRLYVLATKSGWDSRGYATLDILPPLPGQRQRGFLNNGIECRVVVRLEDKKKENGRGMVVFDEVLGAGCFSLMGRTGVACQVWEDVMGDDGVVGRVGKIGGASGRTRKWAFQIGGERERDWVFGLVNGGGR